MASRRSARSGASVRGSASTVFVIVPREPREDGLQRSHDHLEEVDSASERAVHVRLHRILVVQVADAHDGMALPEAVDSPDPLLHAHGVPRHVVVHERSAELEVEASAAASVQSSTSASPSRNRRLASSRVIARHGPPSVGTSPPRPE